MAAKSQKYAFDLLRLIMNAVSIDQLAENNAVNGVTKFYLSLHTADPGAAGTQISSETNYVGYARQAVNRTAAALPCTQGSGAVASSVKLAADATFPNVGAGSSSQVITHWGLGVDPTGAGELLYHGPVSPTIAITAGQAGPILATGTTITEV